MHTQTDQTDTIYCKALLKNGELARGMYTRGPSCISADLARQTTLSIEQPGSIEKLNNEKRVVILRVQKHYDRDGNLTLPEETIIEILE